MTVTEFRWLPHGSPLPEGWKLSDQAILHHHHYAALIERRAEDESGETYPPMPNPVGENYAPRSIK